MANKSKLAANENRRHIAIISTRKCAAVSPITTSKSINNSANNLANNSAKTWVTMRGILKPTHVENALTSDDKLNRLEVANNELNRNHKSVRKSSVQFEDCKCQSTPTPHIITSASNLSTSRNSIQSGVSPTEYPKVSQRISDLRKILNPEEEIEDSLKCFVHCECFEFNLNNAAKVITLVVLLATIILIIKSLTKGI